MTVKDLKEKLEKYPDDAKLLTMNFLIDDHGECPAFEVTNTSIHGKLKGEEDVEHYLIFEFEDRNHIQEDKIVNFSKS